MGTTNDAADRYTGALANIAQDLTKTFDQTSSAWSPQPEYNMMFLRAQQMYMNDLLRSRGHVFLNEVYDALGLSRTREGALVGWTHPSNIDFGMVETEGGFTLTFNIDGVIWDLI